LGIKEVSKLSRGGGLVVSAQMPIHILKSQVKP